MPLYRFHREHVTRAVLVVSAANIDDAECAADLAYEDAWHFSDEECRDISVEQLPDESGPFDVSGDDYTCAEYEAEEHTDEGGSAT